MTDIKPWTERLQRYRDYADYIQKRCRQSGTRAALRSGLRRTPEQAPRMHAVVAARVPTWVAPAEERAYYTVAALIAAQPRNGRDSDSWQLVSPQDDETLVSEQSQSWPEPRPRSLGQALAELEIKTRRTERAAGGDEDTSTAMSPLERRLHALTRQSSTGVHRDLAPIVLRIRGADIAVDWAQLLADLARWHIDQGAVTKRWLQDFYRYRTPSSTTDTSAVLSEGTRP